MSTETQPELHEVELSAGEKPPSELESAILSITLFGGLVVFGAGCFLMGGFG